MNGKLKVIILCLFLTIFFFPFLIFSEDHDLGKNAEQSSINSYYIGYSFDKFIKDPFYSVGFKSEIPIIGNTGIRALLDLSLFVGDKSFKKVYGLNILPGFRFGTALKKGNTFRENILLFCDLNSGLSFYSFPKPKDTYLGLVSKIAIGIGFKNVSVDFGVSKTMSDYLNLTSIQFNVNYSVFSH